MPPRPRNRCVRLRRPRAPSGGAACPVAHCLRPVKGAARRLRRWGFAPPLTGLRQCAMCQSWGQGGCLGLRVWQPLPCRGNRPPRPLRGSAARPGSGAASQQPRPRCGFRDYSRVGRFPPGRAFILAVVAAPGRALHAYKTKRFAQSRRLRRVVAPGRRDYAKREFCIIADLSDRGCFFCGSLPSLFSASPLDFLADVWYNGEAARTGVFSFSAREARRTYVSPPVGAVR